jgi:segregation and condensation protein B
LTKPGLETLTIVAYRGPITKPELELIRGVNCSLILRNLLMRGLVVQQPGTEGDEVLAQYTASPEFLQYLGFTSVQQLPNFDELHSHQLLEELLKQRAQSV